MNKLDNSDEEVKGFRRYFPTQTAWILFGSLIVLPSAVYKFFIENPLILVHNTISLNALFLALFTALIISFSLIGELSLVINHSKHRRIIHYSNEHPLMSYKWLGQNLSVKQWFHILVLIIFIFVLGIFIGKYI